MIDPATQVLIPLSGVRKFCLRTRDRPVHIATLHRWRLHGVRGVKLDAVKVGGRWYTTEQAIRQFVTASSGHLNVTQLSTASRSTIEAEDILKAMGI